MANLMEKLTGVKRIWAFVLAGMMAFGIWMEGGSAIAADLDHGKELFGANCAACHANGVNVIVKEKTLRMDALKANGKDSLEAIMTQIAKGQGAMPGFIGRLSEGDRQDIAAYVLAQAEKDWQ